MDLQKINVKFLGIQRGSPYPLYQYLSLVDTGLGRGLL